MCYLVQSRVCLQLLVVGVLDVHGRVPDLNAAAQERKTLSSSSLKMDDKNNPGELDRTLTCGVTAV